MGIFQLDMTVKTAIELGLDDMRKNPWLIDHMLADTIENPYLRDKYGQKQIDACKEWFLNNDIRVVMRPRNDKDQMPLVTITPGSSPEKEDMKHMGDASTCKTVLMPNQIGKSIGYMVKPFVPTGYNKVTGIVGVPAGTKGIENVSAGMVLVDPDNGQGFTIEDVTAEGIKILAGVELDATRLGVLPKHQYYEARVEHTFMQESCEVGCYGHGDPQNAVWLWSIVLYSILRYRESLLEATGFTQSSVASSGIMQDPYYSGPNGEIAFVRSIQLTGQVENSWIKSPRRIIEAVALREKTQSGYKGGIKILSNLDTPDFMDEEDELWTTVEDDED